MSFRTVTPRALKRTRSEERMTRAENPQKENQGGKIHWLKNHKMRRLSLVEVGGNFEIVLFLCMPRR